MMTQKIGVIHSYTAVRVGFEAMVQKPYWSAANIKDGLVLAKSRPASVVVLGVGDSVEALKSLRGLFGLPSLAPAPAVILYVPAATPAILAGAICYGAFDVIELAADCQVLLEAVLRIGRGDSPAPTSILRNIKVNLAINGRLEFTEGYLSPREHQVLKHVACGLSNLEISGMLSIARETVVAHVRSVMRKINVSDRTNAAIWAYENNVSTALKAPKPDLQASAS
jgi:DNA-binding NarL/FixJ family response regulator